MITHKKTERDIEKAILVYVDNRLRQPGFFRRTPWQAWLHLAIHEPKNFPVSIQKYLDTIASPLLISSPQTSLDLMLHSYFVTHGERLLPNEFLDRLDKPAAEIKENKWKKQISFMSISATRLILNHQGFIIAGVRLQQSQRSSEETSGSSTDTLESTQITT